MSVPKVCTDILTQHMWLCKQDKFATFVSLEGIRNYTPGRVLRNLGAAPPPAPPTTITQRPTIHRSSHFGPRKTLWYRPEKNTLCSQFSPPHLLLALSLYPMDGRSSYAAAFSPPLLPCQLFCPNILILCSLVFYSSGLAPIPLKVLPEQTTFTFSTFLAPSFLTTSKLLGISSFLLCHTPSSFCFCVYGLSDGDVDSARRCRLRAGRGMRALGTSS